MAGTDPFDRYSDDDNLTDSFEFRAPSDPADADTDADGVLDGQEDYDGDGLDDDEELGELRTTEQYIPPYDATIERYYYIVDADPTDPNSDDHGLNDSEKVQKGSNPMRYEVLDVGYATTLGRKDVKIFDEVIVEREINDRELDHNVTTGDPSIIRQN